MQKSKIKKVLVGFSVISMIGLVGCSSTDNMTKQELKKVDSLEETLALQRSHNAEDDTYSRSKYKEELEKVRSDNEKILNEDTTNESDIIKDQELQSCLDTIKFEKTNESDYSYECNVTNNTGKDYNFISFNAIAYDDQGNEIQSFPLSLSNWKSGDTTSLKETCDKDISNANIKIKVEEVY